MTATETAGQGPILNVKFRRTAKATARIVMGAGGKAEKVVVMFGAGFHGEMEPQAFVDQMEACDGPTRGVMDFALPQPDPSVLPKKREKREE